MTDLSYGYALNYGAGKSEGFDAIFCDLDSHTFALCDGANSTPWGGHCSELCASLLGNAVSSTPTPSRESIKLAFDQANKKISETFSNAASTAVLLRNISNKLVIANCGDSQIELLNRSILWGWKSYFTSKLNQDAKGNPNQLIGKNAYNLPDIYIKECKNKSIACLMSDGVHRFTSNNERVNALQLLKSSKPSNDDLNYVCQTIAQQALCNGSTDDISILMVWINPATADE